MSENDSFRADAYGPRVEEILASAESGRRLMPLTTGAGAIEAPAGILGAEPRALFPRSHAPEAALAGLLLYFDRGEAAHAIVQEIETPEASFWHGVVHRREPDAENAAYWFGKTGRHPVFPALANQTREILAANPGSGFTCAEQWDPFAFIEFCESARKGQDAARRRTALEIQRAEWQALFHFCARVTTK